MKWHEVREHFPHQWLLVEATKAHSKANHRILEDLAVLGAFPDGDNAMDGYLALHEESPQRELYVLHTDREELEIEELRWLGVRGVPQEPSSIWDYSSSAVSRHKALA